VKGTDELAHRYRQTIDEQERLKIREEILKIWASYFWRCIHSSGVPQEEKEDVFQDISLDCLLVLDKRWKGQGSFSSVLKSNIFNSLKNYWLKRFAQKRNAVVISLDESPFLEDEVIGKYKPSFLDNEKLSIAYKLATPKEKFVMDRVLEGWTYKKIGEVFGQKSCTIHMTLESLGRRIQKAMKKFHNDPIEGGLRCA